MSEVGHSLKLMRRSYKFQLKPTARQQALLSGMLADHCALYNAALQERRDAYKTRGVTVRYGDQSEQLKAIRVADSDGQGRWSFTSQQQTLRRLNKAFNGFFRRAKAGQNAGYPRFRSVRRFDSVEFVNTDGAKWDDTPKTSSATWTQVRLQGIGHLKVNQHRAIDGRVKTIRVKREGSQSRPRWFVILSCDDVPERPLPKTGAVVGIDLATGSNGLAYLSDGHIIDNPRAFARIEKKLAAVQREAAATKPKPFQRASLRHKRALGRARILHAKAARCRADFLHKAARQLVDTYDVIAHEKMRTANMTRRSKPKPDPEQTGNWLPNGAATKTGLNKSILDSGWGMFIGFINDKAECAGRIVIPVNPAYTSQTCHQCDNVDAAARNGKVYACINRDCGWTGDADYNAALNIERAGLVLLGSV